MRAYNLILMLIFISASPTLSPLINGAIMILMSFLFLESILKSQVSVNIWFKLLLISLFIFLFRDSLDFLNYGGDRFGFLLIPISLSFGVIFYLKYHDIDSFELIYSDIILKLATFSLLIYSLLFFFPQIVSFFPTYTYGGYTSRTIYLFNYLSTESGFLRRNSGFASEPGLFQIFIIFALYLEIKKYGFSRLVRILILTLTTLTTESTLGILLLFLFFMLKSFKTFKFFFIILIMFLFITIVFNSVLIDQYNNKSVNSNYFTERFSPFWNIVYNYNTNFTGIGSLYYSNNFERLNLGSWDSFSQVFIRYGYLPLIFLLGALIKLLKTNFFIGVIIGLSSVSQNIWFIPFVVYLILLYSNNEIRKKTSLIS